MAAPGPGGGTKSIILFFSPRSQVNDLYISSSNATASNTPSVANTIPTMIAPTFNNPLNTRLFYLGAGFNNGTEAGGWYASQTSSFSGSQHNRLFWMYTNSANFPVEYGNLYYTTFQSRSLTATTFTTGVLGTSAFIQNNSFTTPNYAGAYAAATPPTNAPSYNYQLSASKTTITILEATTQSINNWTTLLQDSIRSGSGNTIFETSGQGYKGQFNTSSGTYTFIRGNLPFNPVEAIPVEVSLSFGDSSFSNNPAGSSINVRIISGSTVLRSVLFNIPDTPTVGDFYPFYTTLNIYSGSNGSSANLNTIGGITMSVINPDPQYPVTLAPINLEIKQPLTGKQIAFQIPVIDLLNPTNTPTANDTGSYYVITPNLRGVDNITTPNVGGLGFDAYQLNYIGAIYYFKTAYHLWRDAWKVQAADGGPICPQNIWISASSNPSWAGSNTIGSYSPSPGGSPSLRNNSFLYASRSAANAFIDYGTSSLDAAVRNRAYVGITAELLGGSELIQHLKSRYTNPTSASFPGAKWGGMIVVKASNVGTTNTDPSYRTYPGIGNPSSFIYYSPGLADSGQSPNINANPGLPITQVNDCDIVPLSNTYYEYSIPTFTPFSSSMDWPTNIAWPPADPYSADSFYGYP